MNLFTQKVLIVVVLIASGFVLLGLPMVVHADITKQVTDNLVKSGDAADVDPGVGDRDISGYIGRIIQQILIVAGVIFFVFVVVGGIMWMTAAGSEEQLSRGKKILQNAVIGLIVAIAAFLITRFVAGIVFQAADPGTLFL